MSEPLLGAPKPVAEAAAPKPAAEAAARRPRAKHAAPKPAAEAAGPARSTLVRVRYAETDRMGVVYYAHYLVWFEVARTEWLRATGWSYREMETEGMSLPVIEAHCEYRDSARYDDEIEIVTRATLLSGVRIRFDYDVLRTRDQALAAVGYTVHAPVGPSGRPCRLPDRVRALLS